jgi:hypothetical protein
MMRNDILWKGIIQDLFDDFMRFFFADAAEKFDLSKECQFLDKELEQICPAANIRSSKFIDKLAKIYTQCTPEEPLMLHVEVQDQKVPGFEERMFTYYYRILDRHKYPIAAIVIFTGTNSKFKPEGYRSRCLDTTLSYDFRIYRIADQQEEALLSDNNPFAFVILTVLLAQQFQKQHQNKHNRLDDKQMDEELFNMKLRLAANLQDRHLPLLKQRKLLHFLKHYVPFKTEEYSNKFDNKILFLTNKSVNMYNNMGIEEILAAQAEERALKKGERKGIRAGKRQGVQETKSTIVRSLLDQTNFSVAKIASIAGVQESMVRRLKESAACA